MFCKDVRYSRKKKFMTKIDHTSQNNLTFSSKKQEKIRNKGIAGAYGASSLVLSAGSIGTFGINAGLKEYTSRISKQDSVELRKAVQEGLKKTGLYDEGVRTYYVKEQPLHILDKFKALKTHFKNQKSDILDTGAKSPKEVLTELFSFKFEKTDRKAIKAVKEELLSYGPVDNAINSALKNTNMDEQAAKGFKENILDFAGKAGIFKEKLGLGTSYLPNTKKIIMPSASFQTDAFRQMGRVLNEQGKGAMKILQRVAPSMVAIPAYVLMVSLFDKTTNEDEKPQGFIQNVAHKVKKHAGAISALSLLPMLGLEAMNDIKGTQIAKDLFKDGQLTKNVLNKVKVHNAAAFAACAVSAAAAVASVKIALNVKDKVQDKYKAKLESKEAKNALKAELKAQRAEAKALKNA